MANFDIIIIGAGMTGLALAASLSGQGLSIAVLDQGAAPALPNAEPELRVSAINQASQQLLQACGVWQDIAAKRCTPYQQMHVWEGDSFGQIHFDSQALQQDNLGYIIENQRICHFLWQRCEAANDITLMPNIAIKQLQLSGDSKILQLGDDRLLTAKLLVGADGARSRVRQQAGFAMTQRDYDQKAIVVTVETDLPHQHTAWQVFTPYGPLALLPLWQDNLCSVVWSQDNPRADALLALDDQQFNQAITVAFDNRLGLLKRVSAVQTFPLRMQYVRQWISDGVALVGDAAHTIHPLAGQGVNLGFQDVNSLAQQVLFNREAGVDWYKTRYLRAYERKQKTQSLEMVAAMDGIKHIFHGNNPLLKLLRSGGLLFADNLPPLKQQLIKTALGA